MCAHAVVVVVGSSLFSGATVTAACIRPETVGKRKNLRDEHGYNVVVPAVIVTCDVVGARSTR